MSSTTPATPVFDLQDNQFAMRLGALRLNSSNLTFTKQTNGDILVQFQLTITPHQIGKGPLLKANDPCGVFNIATANQIRVVQPQVNIDVDNNNFITMSIVSPQDGVKGEHGITVAGDKKKKK